MYSLSLPLILPKDRAFFSGGGFEVPSICTGYSLSCTPHADEFWQILVVAGLSDIDAAITFYRRLAGALRCASLHLEHGFQVDDTEPTIASIPVYNGQLPTIFETALNAKPMQANAHVVMSEHLSVLSRQISRALETAEPEKLTQRPELSTAIKIYSEMEFAGGNTAKFVVLFSALEVLVPRAQGRGGKRGPVSKIVSQALQGAGRSDAKAVGKEIHNLYEDRNQLIHEAKPVVGDQVRRLSAIVRDTLRALLSHEGSQCQ